MVMTRRWRGLCSPFGASATMGGGGGGGTPAGPAISVHPANQTVTEPTTATFSVTASGTAPLYYQWYKSQNGTLIPGATSSTYTTPATVYPGDNGSIYFVRVTDGGGRSTTSSYGTLTVNPLAPAAPTVDTHPLMVSKNVGVFGETMFCSASGTSPLVYKWQEYIGTTWTDIVENTQPYASDGTTGSGTQTLSFGTQSTPGTRTFRCKVTNGYGTAYSNSAQLQVVVVDLGADADCVVPAGTLRWSGGQVIVDDGGSVLVTVRPNAHAEARESGMSYGYLDSITQAYDAGGSATNQAAWRNEAPPLEGSNGVRVLTFSFGAGTFGGAPSVYIAIPAISGGISLYQGAGGSSGQGEPWLEIKLLEGATTRATLTFASLAALNAWKQAQPQPSGPYQIVLTATGGGTSAANYTLRMRMYTPSPLAAVSLINVVRLSDISLIG